MDKQSNPQTKKRMLNETLLVFLKSEAAIIAAYLLVLAGMVARCPCHSLLIRNLHLSLVTDWVLRTRSAANPGRRRW